MKVGFIGAGRMATALASGLIESGFIAAGDVLASDVFEESLNSFKLSTKAKTTTCNDDVVRQCDVVILAVKPQVMKSVLVEVSSIASEKNLFVSIAAGVTLNTLESALQGQRVIRVMPNTPALVNAGASAYSRGSQATKEDAELVEKMLKTVGIAVEVQEKLLDAVTGLSGSGPAYAFEIIEALSDGGVLMGLPRQTATQLAAQTLLGAARMVLETGEHPGALKDAVTSPGGTTIAGLHELEQGGMRGVLMNAIQAATLRSQELGN